MKVSRISTITLLLTLLLALLAACGSPAGQTGSTGGSTAASVAASTGVASTVASEAASMAASTAASTEASMAASEAASTAASTAASMAASTEASTAASAAGSTEASAAASSGAAPQPGVAKNPPNKAGQPIVIASVPKLIGIDYFNATQKGMEEAAKELGNVEVKTDGPTEGKVDKQIEFIDTFITQKPDCLTYAANDPVAIAPVLKKALDQGIHVVGYDADAQPDAREWFVNQATFQGIGFTLVDVMAKEAGEDAKVAIVTSSLTAPNQNEWIKYMKQRMAEKYPKMQLLTIQPSEEDQNLAFKVTQDILKTYPDVKGIFGISSVAFPGAADAIKQAGKSGQVKVTGLSTPSSMKKFVKDGTVSTVVLWNAVDLGYATTYACRALIDGKLKPGATELDAGKLGKLKINGSEILLGEPFQFNKDNIDNFNF